MTRYSCRAQPGSCWLRLLSTFCMLVGWLLGSMMEYNVIRYPAE